MPFLSCRAENEVSSPDPDLGPRADNMGQWVMGQMGHQV